MEHAPVFLQAFSEQEKLQFRNLVLIRPQLPSEGQLLLIENMARNLTQPRLLTLIARTPHWLLHPPILMALAENEATPEAMRRDLEMAVSLFDMMREMDKATPQAREEHTEMVKLLYAQLAPELKPVIKQVLKQRAKQVNPTGGTQELPPLPSEQEDWDTLTTPPTDRSTRPVTITLSKDELIERASTTHGVEELKVSLMNADPDIRYAALHNAMTSEEFLCGTLSECPVGELFDDVYGEARWYFRDCIREAFYSSPFLPERYVKKLRITQDLLDVLQLAGQHPRSLHQIVCLFSQLDESEYQFITYWARKYTPHLLRVVKIFYDRLQRKRSAQASGLSIQLENRWATLEERVFMANQGNQPDQLISALKDPDETVFNIVLENPTLTPRELMAVIPSLNTQRAERVANHHTWGHHSAVIESLLHNPQLHLRISMRLLENIDNARALMEILRDPRIPHMEIKQQAMEMLRNHYLSMDLPQRIVTLRSSGGELIRHLPQEVFKDEEALEQLVLDRQVDPSILLRLARNKQTPRTILEHIAHHTKLMAHPPIMTELLLNPKTPRESAIRIWSILSESEQNILLKSPHLPAPLRNLRA